MYCSHKTFHFLSVSDSPTSILSDIVMTLRKSHEIIFVWRIFEKPKILARDVFETSQRRHGKDIFLRYAWDVLKTSHNIFFEMFLRRLKDVTKKTSFLRRIWAVLKTSQKKYLFWDVSGRSLRYLSQWRLVEISQRHLMPAGNKYTRGCLFRNKCVYRISNTWGSLFSLKIRGVPRSVNYLHNDFLNIKITKVNF